MGVGCSPRFPMVSLPPLACPCLLGHRQPVFHDVGFCLAASCLFFRVPSPASLEFEKWTKIAAKPSPGSAGLEGATPKPSPFHFTPPSPLLPSFFQEGIHPIPSVHSIQTWPDQENVGINPPPTTPTPTTHRTHFLHHPTVSLSHSLKRACSRFQITRTQCQTSTHPSPLIYTLTHAVRENKERQHRQKRDSHTPPP